MSIKLDTGSLKEKLWQTWHIKQQRYYFANKDPCNQSYGFSSSHIRMWELDHKRRLSAEEFMLSNCGAGKNSWESLRHQGNQIGQSQRKSVLNILWKSWCWSWSSNTLATWCKELSHWKRPWCWERLKAGGEGDDLATEQKQQQPSILTSTCILGDTFVSGKELEY